MTFRIILVFVTMLLVLPGTVFSTDVPGVSDTEVVVGISTPLSGPAALWGVTALGTKAWADHINDQGGINGRKIKVIIKDDGYNPTRAVSNLKELNGKVFAICGLLGSAPCNANKDFFEANKVPCVLPYANVRIWANQKPEQRKWVFVAYPDYEDEARYLAKYGVEDLKAKKLAVFYQNDDYGKMALKGVKDSLKELGKGELVAAVPHELSETSLGAHALKLKESGADAVILYTNPKHGALITKEMAKAAFKPIRLATFTLADPVMYKIAKKPWEGTYIAFPANSGVPGADKEADKVVDIIVKKNPEIKGKEFLGLFGAVTMIHFAEGLKKAGKDLTHESFIKAMESIKEWKPEGVGAPVTYSANRHHGVNGSRIGIAKGGKLVPLTDKYEIYKPRF